METMVHVKTGTLHIVNKDYGDSRVTLCSLDIDEENWTTDLERRERICNRCRVASGVPARQFLKYGPTLGKKVREGD